MTTISLLWLITGIAVGAISFAIGYILYELFGNRKQS